MTLPVPTDPHFIHDMWRAVDESFRKLGFSLRVQFVPENTGM